MAQNPTMKQQQNQKIEHGSKGGHRRPAHGAELEETHIHLVRGNTFRQRALFQADLSLCAQVLHTDD